MIPPSPDGRRDDSANLGPLTRDEGNFAAHMADIHFNPARHGLAARLADWPLSKLGVWSAARIAAIAQAPATHTGYNRLAIANMRWWAEAHPTLLIAVLHTSFCF